ncbi:hypothetical protein Ancab_010228 [Ancistrocladus abbreviatus]
MQQGRPNYGRPSGTDGSDFSYRMVVDSRYTKVAKGKSRLANLFMIQGLYGTEFVGCSLNHLHIVVVLPLEIYLVAETNEVGNDIGVEHRHSKLRVVKGDDADVRSLVLVALCFVSLIIGESGRRSSKSSFLMFHMILSSSAMLQSVAFTINNNLILLCKHKRNLLTAHLLPAPKIELSVFNTSCFYQCSAQEELALSSIEQTLFQLSSSSSSDVL